MATIREPLLAVGKVTGHPSRRSVTVTYALDLDTDDHLLGHDIIERVVVHAIDEHDAAVRPDRRPVAERTATFEGRAGAQRRTADFIVEQTALDVQQDWWSSGPGGEIRPIAEWPDHIIADISLSTSGRVVAQVQTPTVTGSWGPLASGTD